jgi:hypothetical protein
LTEARLSYSPLLERRIRVGAAESLGTPTGELAVEALRVGDRPAAREYVEYMAEEAARIFLLFSTWIEHLLEFGRSHVEDFEPGLERLRELIGAPPPIVEPSAPGRRELGEALRAAAEGSRDELEAALATLRDAHTDVHDAQADWCWGLLTLFRDALGEERMDEVFRVTQGKWLAERYARYDTMTPEESFQLTIEGMRGHYCGRLRDGRVDVLEDDEKWVMSFDPCGTGGRMRRGDPARDQSPRDEPPYNFAVTNEAHDWSWNRKGVCLYCAHCAVVNEILPIEATGAPMRVTEYPEEPGQPCRWTIYKRPELVPDEAYGRVGRERPSP